MLSGIDISHHQPVTPPLDGQDFVILRASIGIDRDDKYDDHFLIAFAEAKFIGAYHYNWASDPIEEQARVFLDQAKDATILFLDVEGSAGERFTKAQARKFIAIIHAAGRKIGLYMSEGINGDRMWTDVGADFYWVAHYGVDEPRFKDWDFHQYTSSGHVDGYAKRLDMNHYRYDRQSLEALAGVEPMLINAVTNQKVYPKVGDTDDCWVVATWMAAKAIRPDIPKGDATWLRGAAGDPDDGKSDGGTSNEVYRMCRRMWPDIRVVKIDGKSPAWLKAKLQASLRPVSLALWSGKLPARYRFGFGGGHQVVAWWEDGSFWIANPLAPEGSKPQKIAWTDLMGAARAMRSDRNLQGVLFPTKAEAEKTHVQYTGPQLDVAVLAAQQAIYEQVQQNETAYAARMEALIAAINNAYEVAHPVDEVQDPI